MSRTTAEDSRFKNAELNGTTFENGERSQGDQEAEQRMVQNKKDWITTEIRKYGYKTI